MTKIIKISIFGILGAISLSSCSNAGGSKDNKTNKNGALASEQTLESSTINQEKCSDIQLTEVNSEQKSDSKPKQNRPIIENKELKANLCKSISDSLNKGEKPVNAYSNIWEGNIQLVKKEKSQDSFTSLLKDGRFINSYLVKDWISHDNMGSQAAKVLAFGDAPTSVKSQDYQWLINDDDSKAEKKAWGIWDIRFIDDQGKVFKATANDKNAAKYELEADLTADYVKDVFAVFAVPEKDNNPKVYFLKKVLLRDGTSSTAFDVKQFDNDSKTYKEISSNGMIKDLFPAIPEDEIGNIDYIRKINEKQIALFTKSKENNSYTGYYLMSLDDLTKKDAKLTFVSSTGIIQKECSDKENPQAWKSICTVMSDNSFKVTGSSIDRANSSALIIDYQGSKYYYIAQNGILSERKDFKYDTINSQDTLFQITSKKENKIWFIAKDGLKYTRYPDSKKDPKAINITVTQTNWAGKMFNGANVSEILKDTQAIYPLSLINDNNIIILKDKTFINYDPNSNGSIYGTVNTSGYVKDLLPMIKTADIEKISAAINLNNQINFILNDNSGFYSVNPDGTTYFVKHSEKAAAK